MATVFAAATVYVAAPGLVMVGEVVAVIEAVPVADGVNVAVAAFVPVADTVGGLNVPATVDAGVMTSLAGHWPLVGVNVNVTGLPDTPDAADSASV